MNTTPHTKARRFETAAKAICQQEAEALYGGSRKARERVEQYIDNNCEERRAKVVRQYECFLARQSDREQRGPDQALCGALGNIAGRTCGWSSHVVRLETERRHAPNG